MPTRFTAMAATVIVSATCALGLSALTAQPALAFGSQLNPGETITLGNQLSWSGPYGSVFEFVLQAGDGNAVLYYLGNGSSDAPQRALFATNTANRGADHMVMQGDGNLVIYTQNGQALWASNTAGHPGAWLALQWDGNLVIYAAAGGGALWATGTDGGLETESQGAGDCWQTGTPLTCRNTWPSTRPLVFLRALDCFSGQGAVAPCQNVGYKPAWLGPVGNAVSAWNNAPGPQFYSFTPRANDSWVYIHPSPHNQNGLGSADGVTFNCYRNSSGTPICPNGGPMQWTEWSDIYIYDGLTADNDVRFAALHESGHAMGLAHNPFVNTSVMFNQDGGNRALQSPDTLNDIGRNPGCSTAGFGLNCIYGIGH